MFDIKAKSQEATIFFYGSIGDEWGGITDIDFAKELRALGNVREMELRFNSDGGNVFQGMAIYNLLKDHPAQKTSKIDGIAASISSVIPLAASRVIMGEGSTYMIHNPWIITMGESGHLRKTADILDLERDNIADIYAKKTNLEINKIKQLMKDESWFRGKDALAFGFVDETGDDLKIAAKIKSSLRYKNIPEDLKDCIEQHEIKALDAKEVLEQAERAGWRERTAGRARYLAAEQLSAKMQNVLRKYKI